MIGRFNFEFIFLRDILNNLRVGLICKHTKPQRYLILFNLIVSLDITQL
jgi:hypothetical protein